jgi:hypothetical protein
MAGFCDWVGILTDSEFHRNSWSIQDFFFVSIAGFCVWKFHWSINCLYEAPILFRIPTELEFWQNWNSIGIIEQLGTFSLFLLQVFAFESSTERSIAVMELQSPSCRFAHTATMRICVRSQWTRIENLIKIRLQKHVKSLTWGSCLAFYACHDANLCQVTELKKTYFEIPPCQIKLEFVNC